MQGWVIVYFPGGDVYQIFDGAPDQKTSLAHRIAKRSVKTLLTAAQLYWWLKG